MDIYIYIYIYILYIYIYIASDHEITQAMELAQTRFFNCHVLNDKNKRTKMLNKINSRF